MLTGQVYGAGITVTPPGDTPRVTTQLRLVETPEPEPRSVAGPTTRSAKAPARATKRRARAAGPARSGRRAASWGDWHLDAGTRQVGRAGVANARRALEAALEQELRAS
jgi:hypothetical protein